MSSYLEYEYCDIQVFHQSFIRFIVIEGRMNVFGIGGEMRAKYSFIPLIFQNDTILYISTIVISNIH